MCCFYFAFNCLMSVTQDAGDMWNCLGTGIQALALSPRTEISVSSNISLKSGLYFAI